MAHWCLFVSLFIGVVCSFWGSSALDVFLCLFWFVSSLVFCFSGGSVVYLVLRLSVFFRGVRDMWDAGGKKTCDDLQGSVEKKL